MENKILLEISRIKEIMSVCENKINADLIFEEKQLVIEGPVATIGRASYQVALHGDEIFKDLGAGERILNSINNAVPAASRLTKLQITELAKELQSSRQAISTAAKNKNLSNLSDDAYKKLTDLQSKVKGGIDNVPAVKATVEQEITKALDNMEDTHTLNLANQVASEKTFNEADDLLSLGLDETEKFLSDAEMIADYEVKLKQTFTDIGLNLDDFPQYKKWALNKFKDEMLPAYKEGVLTSPTGNKYPRRDFFKERPVNPAADIDNLANKNKGYLRFLSGLYKKIMSIIGRYNPTDSLNQNLERLKAIDPSTIVGKNGVLSKEYETIVRAINYDLEQLADIEKNIVQRWEELIGELKKTHPELVEEIENVKIYDEIGKEGLFQKSESLGGMLERIKKDPGVEPASLGKISTFTDAIKQIFSLIIKIKDLAVKILSNFVSGIFEGWRGLVNRFGGVRGICGAVLKELAWGNIRGPRELGQLFSKAGYGSSRKLFFNFLYQYARLMFFKKIIMAIVIGLDVVIKMGLENKGYDVIDTEEGVTFGDIWVSEFTSQFKLWGYETFGEAFDVWSPVNPKLMVDFIYHTAPRLWVTEVNKTKQELLRSKEEAFNDVWNNMTQLERKSAVNALADSGILKSGFSRLFAATLLKYMLPGSKNPNDKNPGNTTTEKFMKKNKLSIDDIEKIHNSLLPYTDVQINLGFEDENEKMLISLRKKAQELYKNINKQETVDGELKSVQGVVRDTYGKLWTIEDKLKEYIFEFTEYKIQPYYVVRAVTPTSLKTKRKYEIYYTDEYTEAPKPADLNILKAEKPDGFDPNDGSFDDQVKAEAFVKKMNLNQKVEEGEEIDLKTLLKRL